MRESGERETTIGLSWYVSDEPGTGGRLRAEPSDFGVRELETVDPAPADAPPGGYPHLLIRVRLTAWDTNDFARELSSKLGVSRERVGWAGTKDKHAHTTQLFSIRDTAPEELPTITDAEITVVGRFGRPLSFGDLAGNAFQIRVRDTTGSPAPITDDLRNWWGEGGVAVVTDDKPDAPQPTVSTDTDPTDGSPTTDRYTVPAVEADAPRIAVPNWFGHQRFGARRPVTHEVGLRLAADDPRGAVLAYTGSPDEREPDESQRARRVVDEEAERGEPDWDRAREAMPGRLRFECAMLDRLIAWDGSPDLREEFDSKWWAALDAVPSNLGRLFTNAAQSYLFNRILSHRLARGLPFDRPVEGDVVCFREDTPRVARPDPDRTQRATSDRLSVLRRHCERNRAFVTAPLIGHQTTLADGEPGEIEREVLQSAGVEPEDFDLREPYGASGTRRAVLVGCDLAIDRADGDPVFRFSLPSGAYATAVLREYLKTDPERL